MMWPVVTLAPDLVERCYVYGRLVVKAYQDGTNSTRESSDGAESNPILQAEARMAECAFCLLVGVSVEVLDWTKFPDKGIDCPWDRLTYDIKYTAWDGRHNCLCIPAKKTHRYAEMPFDRLVLVKVKAPDCQVRGWIDKDVFLLKHEMAGKDHFLKQGTWWVNERVLEDPQVLVSWRDYTAAYAKLKQEDLWF